MTGLTSEAAHCLGKAARFAVEDQGADGSWSMPPQPRVLENAVVACSLTHVQGERAERARARVVAWLRGAAVQRHDPFVAAADRWLVEAATADGVVPPFTGLSATAGPHAAPPFVSQSSLGVGQQPAGIGAGRTEGTPLLHVARLWLEGRSTADNQPVLEWPRFDRVVWVPLRDGRAFGVEFRDPWRKRVPNRFRSVGDSSHCLMRMYAFGVDH